MTDIDKNIIMYQKAVKDIADKYKPGFGEYIAKNHPECDRQISILENNLHKNRNEHPSIFREFLKSWYWYVINLMEKYEKEM